MPDYGSILKGILEDTKGMNVVVDGEKVSLDDVSRLLDEEDGDEGVIDEGYKESQLSKLNKNDTWIVQIHDDSDYRTKWLNIDQELMDALNKAWKSKK